MAEDVLIPILRFADGTVMSRVIEPDTGRSQQSWRTVFDIEKVEPARQNDRQVVYWEPNGIDFNRGLGSILWFGSNCRKRMGPSEETPPWGRTADQAKFLAMGRLLNLFDGLLEPHMRFYERVVVPKPVPDWLLEHLGEPTPPELSDLPRLRFHQKLLADYVDRNAFCGRGRIVRTMGSMSPSWVGVDLELPAEVVKAFDYRGIVMTITAKESTGLRGIRWAVSCAGDVYAGRTMQEALDRIIRWGFLFWPESRGLQTWLEEASFPVDEILIDADVLETYQLLGTKAPWLWSDAELSEWLQENP
jgi:hypothetical protein